MPVSTRRTRSSTAAAAASLNSATEDEPVTPRPRTRTSTRIVQNTISSPSEIGSVASPRSDKSNASSHSDETPVSKRSLLAYGSRSRLAGRQNTNAATTRQSRDSSVIGPADKRKQTLVTKYDMEDSHGDNDLGEIEEVEEEDDDDNDGEEEEEEQRGDLDAEDDYGELDDNGDDEDKEESVAPTKGSQSMYAKKAPKSMMSSVKDSSVAGENAIEAITAQSVERSTDADAAYSRRQQKQPPLKRQKRQKWESSSSPGEEGEDDDEEDEEEGPDNEGDLELSDSDIESYTSSAKTSVSNLTRRQRAKLNKQSKKMARSKEEIALRRSEHARRRKFQSMQRAEQLKNDTINRLLNKQTSKGRNKLIDDTTINEDMWMHVHSHQDTRPSGAEDEASQGDGSTGIRYRSTVKHIMANGSTPADTADAVVTVSLSLPVGTDVGAVLPGAGKLDEYPKPLPRCSVVGCNAVKKYNVIKPGVGEYLFACSLEHFRQIKAQ
ncbi:INO80 complex subunit B [Spiromyces aspiralis]|uniref:INO80 complex subunit B n=1 Tax=Spiromyces aspiralis TaxID=68401 RepID=A0ACC1HFK0_9FUNG|nr:INO80 complex subunit B [Spiromyces aspiralis]